LRGRSAAHFRAPPPPRCPAVLGARAAGPWTLFGYPLSFVRRLGAWPLLDDRTPGPVDAFRLYSLSLVRRLNGGQASRLTRKSHGRLSAVWPESRPQFP